jgi:hypothetical protein
LLVGAEVKKLTVAANVATAQLTDRQGYALASAGFVESMMLFPARAVAAA